MFHGKKLGMGCGQNGNRLLRKLQDLVRSRPQANRNKNVKSAAARRFRKRLQTELLQELIQQASSVGGVSELSRSWIEVKADPIRLWERFRATARDMHGDTAEVHKRHLRRDRTTENVICGFPFP